MARFCTCPFCKEDRAHSSARCRTRDPGIEAPGLLTTSAWRLLPLDPEQRAHRKPRHDAIHRETDGEAAGAIERISRDDGHRAQPAGIRKMTDREQSAKMFFRPEYFRQSERKK